MKDIKLILLPGVVVLLLASAVSAQTLWRPMAVRSRTEYELGMPGGEGEQHMYGFARSESNPDVIYLAHDCATLWRSGDAGLTWQKLLCEGMIAHGGESVEVDPLDENRVFAVVDNQWNTLTEGSQGVYRSTDGGQTWTHVLAKDTASLRSNQHRIEFDPTSVTASKALRWYVAAADNPPGDTYAENADAAIWRSEDGGDTWTRGASLVGHDMPAHLHCHPSDGQTLYLASEEGLFVSHDRGATLQPLGNLPAGHVPGLAINPQNPNEIWATVWHNDLYHSTDGGQTFTKMNMTKASAAYHVFLNPGHPNVLYYVPEWGESWVSANGGATWTVSTTTPRPALSSHWKWDFSGKMSGVAGDPRDPLKAWGYARATFFRTVDGGLNWTDSANGFTGYAWGWWHKSVAWDPDQPLRWMMFCYDVGPQKTENDGLWFTSHGVPWEWIGYGPGLVRWGGAYSGEFQPGSNGQVVLCNFGDYFYTKLLRSTDGGNTWTIVIDVNNTFWFVGFHPTAPNVAWAGPYRSLDGGVTWAKMTALTDLGEYAEVIGYAPSQPDTVYAAWQGTGRIYRSDDRGATWRLYVDATFKFGLMDRKPIILPHPTDANSLIALNSSTGGLSCYDGTSWTNLVPIGVEGGPTTNFVRTIAIDPRYPDIMYVAMNTPGLAQIFRTTDGGHTWEDIASNLSRVGGGGLQVSPYTGDLLHGSCFGTWVYPPPYDSPNALYHRLAESGTVVGWESVAAHGPAGKIAMPLADGATEPRESGLSKVRIAFDSPVDPATAGLGAVTINGNAQGGLSGQIKSAVLDASGMVLTVTLTESLPDADVYRLAVTDQVRTSDGRPIGGDRELVLQVLAGDVDGSATVTAADILAVRASVGGMANAATAYYDVDGSGMVTGADLLAVRRYLGHTLP